MVESIIPAKLIAERQSAYTVYVFQNTETGDYIMCTRLPNWQTPEVFLNEEGFLQFQEVKAGEEYYDISQEKNIKYLYSNVYFKNFIKKSEFLNSEITI